MAEDDPAATRGALELALTADAKAVVPIRFG